MKGDGSKPAVTDMIAPSNLILHTLFNQVDVQIQQQLVSSTGGQMYGYKAYIETLLDYGRGLKESKLQMEGYYKDTAGFMEDTESQANIGWAERRILSIGVRGVELEGAILSDLCQQPRLIVNGVELQIKLWSAKDEFTLMSSEEGSAYRIQFVEAYFCVCKITPIPAVLLAHAELLKEKPAIYPFTRTKMKAFQLSKGQYSFHLEDMSNVPNDLVVAMVNADSYSGSYSSNPYTFQHYDLSSLGVYLDDESIPAKPLKMNFTQRNYLAAYGAIFNTYEEEGNFISRAKFPEGYSLFVFRLLPDHLPPFLPSSVRGNVKLSGNFDKPLPENVTLLVYAKFPALLTIDTTRNVQI